ncbi:hypothetical protein DVH24_007816 [Malus domestica]|uniref:Uncharacterized protein n=1 Tax=Malus domestica TaxID=3750 RepID=A0A498JPU8_MALDO|nr:hypothetical protein DVH24_007816 [Malus domestica]
MWGYISPLTYLSLQFSFSLQLFFFLKLVPLGATGTYHEWTVALVKRPKYWLVKALGGEVELERTKQRPNLGIDVIFERTEKTNEVFCWVEDATDSELVGVICEANGGVKSGVIDESEVGGIGDVGEGVEEEVKSRGGERKRWLRRRTMRTTKKDRWVDGSARE